MSLQVPVVTATTSAVSSPRVVAGGDLGAHVVVGLATVVSVATVGGWLGWPVLSNRPAAAVLVVSSIAVAVLGVRRLRPRSTVVRGSAPWVLAVPALGVLAPTVVGALRGAPGGIEWFLNGDHPRHAVYVADTWAQGNLTYGVEGYPRGLHSALAAGWSVVGAGFDPSSAVRLLELMAVSSMLLSAVLALALAHLGHTFAVRFGLGEKVALLIGLVVGSTALLATVLGNYQALGYENSILSAVVLVVCCREVLLRAGSGLSLLVCASGALLIAHSWQLLLPSVAVAAGWCAWVAVRDGGRRQVLAVLACVLGVVALGAPGVLAVVNGVGIAHATEVGPRSPVPVVVLVLGLLSTVVLSLRHREGAVWSVAGMTALPALTAVALSLTLRIALLDYYPSKLLWQAAVLALPWLAVAVALVLRAAVARYPGVAVPLRTVGVALIGLFVAFALVQPWGGQLGIWSTVDGRRVLAAVTTPGATGSTVVWLQGTGTQDAVTRSVIDVMRVGHTRSRAAQASLTHAEECALLAASPRPVVLSTAPEAAVRVRFACAPDLDVVPVEGPR